MHVHLFLLAAVMASVLAAPTTLDFSHASTPFKRSSFALEKDCEDGGKSRGNSGGSHGMSGGYGQNESNEGGSGYSGNSNKLSGGNEDHSFQPAKGTDSRSPCPWINAMANHGYLPRDGKNISLPQILDKVKEVFNVAPEVTGILGKLSILCSPNVTTFSLQDTALHGCIEHDGSLSRSDKNLGDNIKFNGTLYTALSSLNSNKDFYDVTAAGQAISTRVRDSSSRNPKFVSNGKENLFRSEEAALYLSVMGDGKTGRAPKKVVDAIFREDRLPFQEGWKRPETPITAEVITSLVPKIMAANGFVPNNATYENATQIVLS